MSSAAGSETENLSLDDAGGEFADTVSEVESTFSPSEAVVNPLTTLNDKQKQMLDELKAKTANLKIGDAEKAWLTDMTLYRYLVGWKWNLGDAFKKLFETLVWRAQYKPQDVRLKDIEPVYKNGWLYETGFDRLGHPLVYMQLGKDAAPWDEKNNELKFKNIVYCMESAMKRAPEGIYNCTFVVDLKGSSLNLQTIKNLKNLFVRLGDVYCESLFRCVVMNAGLTFQTIWNFVKVFLAKSTIDKYVFVKHSAQKVILAKYIDADQFITSESLGGGYGKSSFNFAEDMSKRLSNNQ